MAKKFSDSARMTVTVPQSTREAIGELAKYLGVTDATAAQHLIRVGLTVEAFAMGGGEVFSRLPNGEVRVLADREGNFINRLPFPKSE